jgi:purine nucleoside permease
MQMRNNKGEVVAEQNVGITKEGSVVSTQTMYSNGQPIVQNISVRDNQGNVRTESIFGGKLLP